MLFINLVLLCIFFLTNISNGYNNGIGELPAMGWSTWCSVGNCGADLCYENEIKEIIDALYSNGMYQLGYNHIHLDDCWGACHRTEGLDKGELMADPQRFPSGMPHLIEYAHNKSIKVGLYTAAGIDTCHSFVANRPCPVISSYDHWEEDANTFAKWGVDWVSNLHFLIFSAFFYL